MGKKLRRLVFALLVIGLLCSAAAAEVTWPQETEGQKQLGQYMERVNTFLSEQGEQPVNSLFEAYQGLVTCGITDLPDATMPEGVEITVQLFRDSMNSLQVRVNYIPRFPQVAAAFIRALNPEGMTMAEALTSPTARAKKAADNPGQSFEEEVEELNGTVPYIYYAYYPNQYRDGTNWIQMTIVFPLAGTWDGSSLGNGATVTKGPDTYSGSAEDYEGYFSGDSYSHYEYFVTPTPEPDSAAGDHPMSFE